LVVQVGLLLAQLFNLESGELAQRHGEDGFCLVLTQEIAIHQTRLGLVCVSRASDEPNHVVEVVDRGDEALHYVKALPCLPEIKLRASPDDDDAMVNEGLHG